MQQMLGNDARFCGGMGGGMGGGMQGGMCGGMGGGMGGAMGMGSIGGHERACAYDGGMAAQRDAAFLASLEATAPPPHTTMHRMFICCSL